MALSKCSECGREVSDKATACPGCGARISLVPDIVTRPIRVRRTSRKWEAAGFVLIVMGIVIVLTGAPALGWPATIAGFVVFLIGSAPLLCPSGQYDFTAVQTHDALAKTDWVNELHPYPPGFEHIAQKFLTAHHRFPTRI